MSRDLLGVYQPGSSFLHRMPAGAKIAALAAISLLTVLGSSALLTALVLATALALLLVARARAALVLRTLRGMLVMMTLLALYQAWQRGPERAFTVVGALVALILLATVLTVTTSVDEMLDAITRACRPLRRVGVDPELVALAFSLLIRGIPTTLAIAAETAQAAKARGLERDPRALLTPMVIRVVAHAHATGEALHARGIGDDRPGPD